VFRTAGDTEVLVHLYEERGPDLVEDLNGMFAFALWDRRRRRLLLARDRLGIKPLYWTEAGGALLFASEIKALLQAPQVRRRLRREVLGECLAHTEVYGGETLLEGIHRLPPAHLLLATRDGVRVRRYWRPEPRDLGLRRPAEALEALDVLLRDAVRRQMVSDVPLGVFLSGGVDSSVLASLMTEVSGRRIQTFCIGFESAAWDERPFARAAAACLGAEHFEYTLSEREFCDRLPEAVWHHDTPIKHHACVPLMILARHTKGRATVILSGEGADEVFLGYRKYRLARWQRAMNAAACVAPAPVCEAVAALGRRLFPGKFGTKVLGRLAVRDAGRLAELYGSDLGGELLAQFGLMPDAGVTSAFLRAFRDSPFPRMDQRHSVADLETCLQSLLVKQDKMTMAAGIETRVPFLDHRVVEFGLNLPLRWKIRAGEGKVLLKRLAARRMPADLVYRRKMGFSVPLTEWLRRGGPFRRLVLEVLTDPRTRRRGYFDYSCLESHLADVERGRWGNGPDAAAMIWALLNLELWHRRFFDAPVTEMTFVVPEDRRLAGTGYDLRSR